MNYQSEFDWLLRRAQEGAVTLQLEPKQFAYFCAGWMLRHSQLPTEFRRLVFSGDETPILDVLNTEFVEHSDRCPQCHQRVMDKLQWIDDTVECVSCGHRYDPSS